MNRVQILREVVSKLTPMLAGKGLRVTQIGTQARAECDAKGRPVLINIPYIADDASEDFCLAIQGFIDHEVAHVLFTDWDVPRMAASRGADKAREFNHNPELGAKRMHMLANMLEDTFIERKMCERFKGTGYNLDKLYTIFLHKIIKDAVEKTKDDPKQRFNVLLVVVVRAWSGQSEFKRFLDDGKHWDNEYIKALLDATPTRIIDRIPKMKDSWECLEVAEELYNILYPKKDPEPESEDDKDCSGKGDGEGGGGESDAPPEGGSGKSGSKSKPKSKSDSTSKAKPSHDDASDESSDDAGEEDTSEDDAGEKEEEDGADEGEGDAEPDPSSEDKDGGEGETPETDETGDDEPDETDDSGKGEEEDEDPPGESDDEHEEKADEKPRTVFHDFEADPADSDAAAAVSKIIGDEAIRQTRGADYTVLTQDWDRIEPPDDCDVGRGVEGLEEATRHMVGPMQKHIERMMASRTQTVKIPGFRSGRLHGGSLHRLHVNDDRVFRRLQVNLSKATAVSLLVDNSGSMNGPKIRIAMQAAYALSQTLERVGIKHEVLGFTCYNASHKQKEIIHRETALVGKPYTRWEPIYMPIYKGFDERINPLIKRRFVMGYNGTIDLSGNIDGECVRYAGNRLVKRTEVRKVLIVLSDGQPAGWNGNYHKLASDLHAAVAELDKKKIECVGLGILDQSVKTFYPKYSVLRDLNALPGAVMGELQRILVS
jgi:cobalamin biosynthesis protein CobT